MTKPPVHLQDLRRRIYRKAKSDQTHRFWGLFVHIAKMETLEEAYCNAKRNGGAGGIDGQSFEDIETQGRSTFLAAIREDLVTGRYKPKPNRRVDIPKGNGKVRTLQIPCIPRSRSARSGEANPRSHLRSGFLHKLLRVSPSAFTTPRAGGSQTQCVATYVYGDRC